ncbi:MAG: serine/threonine-protein kinase [Cyanobacteria bacterium P01_G01_bin.19]
MILNGIYQVQSQLSKRGGKETLLAQNLNTNELVVVKIFKFGLDSGWQDFKLFEREVNTLKNLSHPAIPQYLDYFELNLPHSQGFALVESYIDAPDLTSCLKAGRSFSQPEITEIAIALLEIIVYLHQQQPNIIHRDIKPSNILLSERSGNSAGKVYLIDFGAVKNMAAAEGGTITIVGTYGYMPPEQFGGKAVPASDLYSLGATLIYLATGKHPTDLPSKDGRILFADLVNLDSSLVGWIEKAIEPSLDRRFTSATEALKALKNPVKLAKQPEAKILKQPRKSKIKLRKTAQAIEIVVPSRGISGEVISLATFTCFWNGFLVVWTGLALFMTTFPINILFSLFSIPFWAAGFVLARQVILLAFTRTRLKIDSQHIALFCEWGHFKRQKPKPNPINTISKIKIESSNTPPSMVIWANEEAYRLNGTIMPTSSLLNSNLDPELSNWELNWLVYEIESWLAGKK